MGMKLQQPGREDGMAMLEMTIVLPLLLLVVFSILEMGLAFARFQVVSNAAREGAREASLFRLSCDPGTVAGEVQGVVTNFGGQLGIGPADLGVTVVGACGAGESTVTVTYTHDFFALPELGSVPSTIDLVGRSVMRNEL